MMNSIATGADGQANYTLSVLRGKKREGRLADTVKFIPGVSLRADPGLAIEGAYRSPRGRLLELEARLPGRGDWVGLHIDLPARDLGEMGVLGYAARISASDVLVVQACLRSGTEDGFEDHFFDKHLLFRPEEASHIDAMSLHHREGLPMRAPWRELVFFLPTQDFHLSFLDLRVFIV